ncbi:hypothetical protein PV683_39200, partial [Streptomyces sp. AK08-01B]|nr:hypothetical protein [Streptomyces sp. AK08-01B]MDX3821301.1 hypothetical protein [Streptomyces sp. AK08-01A]
MGTPDFARAIGVTFDVKSVYRHPTRADLVIAVYRHQVDACAEAGPALLATSPTPHALRVRVGLQLCGLVHFLRFWHSFRMLLAIFARWGEACPRGVVRAGGGVLP